MRTKSDASTASIEARVMRAIGASEKIASVSAGRISWLSAEREGLEIAGDQRADQVEAGHRRRRAVEHVEPFSGAGDHPSRTEDVDQHQPR